MKPIRSSYRFSLLLSVGLASLAVGAWAAEKPPLKVMPKTLPDELRLSLPPVSSSQLMYQYLLSEIAGQRGVGDLAAQGMRDLASRARDARLARRATELAFEAKQMGEARESLMLWLELEPESAFARQALGVLLIVQGNLDKTVSNIHQWLADPVFARKHAPSLFLQLPFLLSRQSDRNDVNARKKVATIIAELALPYTQMAEAQTAVGMAALAAGHDDTAKGALAAALKLKPTLSAAVIAEAERLRSSTRADGISNDLAAATYLEQVLLQQPNATDVRIAYARTLVGMKSLLGAREAFRRAARERLLDAEMAYATGLIALQLEDWADAEANFRAALTRQPRDKSPLFFNLALTAEGKKDVVSAIDWYRQIQSGDYYTPAQLRLARHLLTSKDLAAARQSLNDAQRAQEALIADGESHDIYQQLVLAEVQLLREANADAEGYTLLTSALMRDPKSIDFRYDRAMVAERLGKLREMEDDLRTIINIKPDHAHAHNALGYSFAERGVRLD